MMNMCIDLHALHAIPLPTTFAEGSGARARGMQHKNKVW